MGDVEDENGTPTPKKGRRGRKRKMQSRKDDDEDEDTGAFTQASVSNWGSVAIVVLTANLTPAVISTLLSYFILDVY